MSAQVDVVAIVRGIAAKFRRMANDANNVNAIDLDNAAAAIAELIAADKEYDEAKEAHGLLMQWALTAARVPSQEQITASAKRCRDADIRRASALAAVGQQS